MARRRLGMRAERRTIDELALERREEALAHRVVEAIADRAHRRTNPTGSAPATVYNLWNGFAVEPRKGKCDLYLKHVRENIAQGDKKVYDYLLTWMADAVQNPAKRPGVAIALRGGAQGTGKGVFATQFGSLFSRPHFVHLQSMRQLTGPVGPVP